MPSVAAIALETLLDPNSTDPSSTIPRKSRNFSNGYFISPQLYTTPEPALIVPTTGISSSSPSPYVVNHKRRDFPALSARFPREGEDKHESEVDFRSEGELVEEEGEDNGESVFFELREGMSGSDAEDASGSGRFGRSGRCSTPTSGQSEFYDAPEDFVPEVCFSRATLEADLRSIRLNLFEEIEKRRIAEETVEHLQSTLQRMHQFWQETAVTRMVTETLETALARAEVEVITELKNREISRLRDRLQYYEAVNQEMCHRNQEAIELARRQRQRRKTHQKWVASGICLSLAVGASLAVYFYFAGDEGISAESESAEKGNSSN